MTDEKPQQQPQKLVSVNEIIFSMMAGNLDDEYRELLIGDPHEFIFSWYNVEMKCDIHIVENNDKIIHLALPFYRPAAFRAMDPSQDK